MNALYDCLKDTIGLSDNTCPCFNDNEKPVDFNVSKSGLFITDTEYSVPIKMPKSIEDCGNSSVWSILEKARKEGFNQMLTDIAAAISDSPFQTRYAPFSGLIADDTISQYISGLNTRVGIAIVPRIWKGVIAKIHSVRLYLDTAGTYDVDIFLQSKLIQGDYTPERTVSVTITSAQTYGETVLKTNGEIDPFVVDFSQNNGLDAETIYIVYSPAGASAWNVKFNCGCSGSMKYWQNYLTGYGVQTDSDTGLTVADTSTVFTYGVRVNMSMSCGMDWLCADWDFSNDTWARVFADVFLLYANRKLISFILNENRVEPFTLFGRDELFKKRDEINAVLQLRVPWLVSKLPDHASDCFVCNERARVAELTV